MTARPRLHVLYEHDVTGNPHGCSHVRLLRPLSHPALAARYDIAFGLDLPAGPVDLLIVERLWRADIAPADIERLLCWCRQNEVPLLYTLDDDLLDLRLDEPWQIFPQPHHRIAVARLARAAKVVVVTTPALAERFARLGARVRIVPNFVDASLYAAPAVPSGEVLRFGYMGTYTHLDDLLLVLPALRTVLKEATQAIAFEIVGIACETGLADLFAGLPVRLLAPGDAFHYPDFVLWMQRHLRWDFAIAPLCDTAFNRAKSDLKFLDYAMLGIPGIYSRVPSYAGRVIDGENGLLADNETQCWQQALTRMIEDASLRARLRVAARNHVLQQRTLAQGVEQWQAVIEQALAS